METRLSDAPNDFFYPGTYDRGKAEIIPIVNHMLPGERSLDFNLDQFTLVPIKVSVDLSATSDRYMWRVQLLQSDRIVTERNWTKGDRFTLLYGVRGVTYSLSLYGWSARPLEYQDCRPRVTVKITAKPGLPVITVPAPSCQ